MVEFADALFQGANVIFPIAGVLIILASIGFAIGHYRFKNNALPIGAKVIAHSHQRSIKDKENNRTKNLYRPVFALIDGVDAGLEYTSSQEYGHDAYPIGTIWPAQYDPRTGKIRTKRSQAIMPYFCAAMLVVGAGFVVIPQLDRFDDKVIMIFSFCAIGMGLIAAALVNRMNEQQRYTRQLAVTAELDRIDVTYGTERKRVDVPVMRILSGQYAGVECTEVAIGDVAAADIGQTMPAAFDPFSGHLQVTEGKQKAASATPSLAVVGFVFCGIGIGLHSLV